jgi:hypothetical protein
MMPLKLRFADEPAWLAARTILFDAKSNPLPGVEIVDLGTLYRETGNTVTVTGMGGQPMQVPERVASAGYHIDAIVPDTLDVSALRPFMLNPTMPKHVWAGNLVLAMPETLPEAEEVAMVTRGIGAQVPDDQLARIELQLLRGRITPDMAEDRRAWVEAGEAILEARIALAEQRQLREKAVEDARRADAERDRLLAERQAAIALRDAEDAKRVAAVAAAQASTGKARADAIAARDAAVAARDAATATATTLLAELNAEVEKLAAAVKARDDASAIFGAEAVKIEAARAARAVAKAAIKD